MSGLEGTLCSDTGSAFYLYMGSVHLPDKTSFSIEYSGHVFGRLFTTDCLRTRVGLTAIAPIRGLSYRESEVMNMDTKTYVVGLLESYQKRSKQIDLLHYELSHPARVSENEMIGALALAHGEGGDRPGGHASDKTLYIALNYQERTEEANQIGADEVVEQLVTLEKEQERLKYYVSLLKARHKKVIQMFYFDEMTPDEVAETLQVTVRYAHSIKSNAINELVSMYEYMDGLR